MKARCLAGVAGVIFAASFLLPAYGDANGFKCFSACWNLLLQLMEESKDSTFTRIYYSAFVLTNLAFIVVLVSGVFSSRFFRARFVLSMIAFAHVASWFIVNLSKESVESIKVGYYGWLLAYALLLVSLLVETKRKPTA